MADRGQFLTQPYGAYLTRDVPQEDVEMTHVGPGTPAGEYLRRSWQPIAFSDDLKDLPIVAVTAKAMKGDREKCIEAGAWDYLSKPVDPEQLLAVLRAWLHRFS